ncbi:MAG: hypothetical protein K2N63_04225, partial [Lachnospiraceae bacterium]|nr:hypothetical protein [Lachnospiraceae bacterium]
HPASHPLRSRVGAVFCIRDRKLLQMIEEGESEEELSKAVRRMTGGGESESIVKAAIQKAQETKKFRPVQKGVAVVFPGNHLREENISGNNMQEDNFSSEEAALPEDGFPGLAPLSTLVSILEKRNNRKKKGEDDMLPDKKQGIDLRQEDGGMEPDKERGIDLRWTDGSIEPDKEQRIYLKGEDGSMEPDKEQGIDLAGENQGEDNIHGGSGDMMEAPLFSGSAEEEVQVSGFAEQETDPDPLYEYPPELFADYAREAPLLDASLKKRNLKVEEFFNSFLASPDLRRQIFTCMERILQDKNRAINIILTGEEKSGKTKLAKSIAKCTQVLGGISSPRVAVIRGDKLNHIDLETKKEQLKATTMIVEHAAGMSSEKVAQLLSLNGDFAGETAVILEEERRRMNHFLRMNEELDRVYINRIHLPEWSVDDCFMQALWMLYSNEYYMTETVAEGFLYAVRNQIEEHRDNPFDAVLSYTDAVLKRADKRMSQMLRGFAMDGKYREEELTMLRREDL